MVITPSTASGPPPSKMEAFVGEPLSREPPKSVKHFSGNPYHENARSDGAYSAGAKYL